MRITRALYVLFFALVATLSAGPTSAMDRTNNYYGMNPSSGWSSQYERDVRLGFGQWIADELNQTPTYSHIAVSPSTGYYVQVAPSAPNSLGDVEQLEQDDTNPYGSGATQLSADPTLVFVQGLLSTPPIALGPLTPPSTSGQSTIYLAECQVVTVSRTPQTELFEISPPTVTSQSANRDLSDTVACQSKAGASATNPSPPSTDSGWVPIALIKVPSGQSALTASDVTMEAPFSGFVQNGQTLSVATFPHGDYVDTSSNQLINGTKTFGSNIVASGYTASYGSSTSSYNATSSNVAGTASATNFIASSGFSSGSSVINPSGITSAGTIVSLNGIFAAPTSVTTLQLCPANSCQATITSAGLFSAPSVAASGSITAASFTSSFNIYAGNGVYGAPAGMNNIQICPNNACQGINAGVNGIFTAPTVNATTVATSAFSDSGNGTISGALTLGSLNISGNAAVGGLLSVAGNANISGQVNAGSTITAINGSNVPYIAGLVGQPNAHIEISNGGGENNGAGTASNGIYTATFAKPYTNSTSFACPLSLASNSGSAPTTGAVYIQSYNSNSNGQITGMTWFNGTNAVLNIGYLCIGY